mmetsp:Transcript_11543/g.28258  ORF Transcript_11543/g.28258 Transcript_11543/m.28258 type:complete len:273 (+) Transcript_11543:330-1148(+)
MPLTALGACCKSPVAPAPPRSYAGHIKEPGQRGSWPPTPDTLHARTHRSSAPPATKPHSVDEARNQCLPCIPKGPGCSNPLPATDNPHVLQTADRQQLSVRAHAAAMHTQMLTPPPSTRRRATRGGRSACHLARWWPADTPGLHCCSRSRSQVEPLAHRSHLCTVRYAACTKHAGPVMLKRTIATSRHLRLASDPLCCGQYSHVLPLYCPAAGNTGGRSHAPSTKQTGWKTTKRRPISVLFHSTHSPHTSHVPICTLACNHKQHRHGPPNLP